MNLIAELYPDKCILVTVCLDNSGCSSDCFDFKFYHIGGSVWSVSVDYGNNCNSHFRIQVDESDLFIFCVSHAVTACYPFDVISIEAKCYDPLKFSEGGDC